jgi:hypothetical protein
MGDGMVSVMEVSKGRWVLCDPEGEPLSDEMSESEARDSAERRNQRVIEETRDPEREDYGESLAESRAREWEFS